MKQIFEIAFEIASFVTVKIQVLEFRKPVGGVAQGRVAVLVTLPVDR